MSDNPLADQLDEIEDKVDESLKNDQDLPNFMKRAVKEVSSTQKAITNQSLKAVSNLGNSITGSLKSHLRNIGSAFGPTTLLRRGIANSGAMAPVLNLGLTATEKTFDASKEFLSGILSSIKEEREKLEEKIKENDQLSEENQINEKESLFGSAADDNDGILDRIANGIEDMVYILKKQFELDEEILETQREQAFARAESLFESKKRKGKDPLDPGIAGDEADEKRVTIKQRIGQMFSFLSQYLDELLFFLFGKRLLSQIGKEGAEKVAKKHGAKILGNLFKGGSKFIGRLFPFIGFIVDGILGALEFKDSSVISSFIGGALGGTFKNKIINTFVNAGKWAIIGAVAGSGVAPIVGTIAGGLLGAVIGAVLGAIGGETIARKIDSALSGVVKRFISFLDVVSFFIFGKGIEEIFLSFKDKMLGLVQWTVDFFEEQKQNFLKGFDIIKEKFSAIRNFISEEFNLLLGFLKENLIKIIGKERYEKIVGFLGEMVDKVEYLIDLILKKVKQLINIIEKKVLDPVKKTVSDAAEGFAILGRQVKSAFVSGEAPQGTRRRAIQDVYTYQKKLFDKFATRNSESDALYLQLLSEGIKNARSAKEVHAVASGLLRQKNRKEGPFKGVSTVPREKKKTEPKESFRGGPSMSEIEKTVLDSESGGNPGAIGFDRNGGASYGLFQFSSRQGVVQKFLEETKYGKYFKGMTPGSPQFDAMWKQLAANDPGFSEEQKNFHMRTHMKPFMDKLEKQGYKVSDRGDAVKAMILSTATQHGPNAQRVVTRAFDSADEFNKMSDEEIIKRVQNEKARRYQSDFRSSTPSIQLSAGRNRALREKEELIQMAQLEKRQSLEKTQQLQMANLTNTQLRDRTKKASSSGPPMVNSVQNNNQSNQVFVNPRPARNSENTFVRTQESQLP